MTVEKNVPYRPPEQERVVQHVSAGINARWRIDVPADARPGAKRPLFTYEFDDGSGSVGVPFQAGVTLTQDPNDFSGSYGAVSRRYTLQVAGGGLNADRGCRQVEPGSTWYVTATLAHDNKIGRARSGKAFAMAVELGGDPR